MTNPADVLTDMPDLPDLPDWINSDAFRKSVESLAGRLDKISQPDKPLRPWSVDPPFGLYDYDVSGQVMVGERRGRWIVRLCCEVS